MLDSFLYAAFRCGFAFLVGPLLIITIAISWIFSVVVQTIARFHHPEITRFDDRGALWYALPHVGKNKDTPPYVNIVLYIICEGKITIEQLRLQVQSTVLSMEPLSCRKFWRLRQCLTTILGYLFWEPVPNFDLCQHVRLYNYDEPELCLPAVVTEKDLCRTSSAYMAHAFPKFSSPWEMLLVPNYLYASTDSAKPDTEHCAIIFKIHHAMADASACADLLESLFNCDDQAGPTMVERVNTFPGYTWQQKFRRNLSIAIRMPMDFGHKIALAYRSQNGWTCRGKETGQKYWTQWSEAFPMQTLTQVRSRHEAQSVAAVFHTLVTGAILETMQENGQKLGESMSILYGYPLAGHPGGLTNHFTIDMYSFSPKLNRGAESRLLKISSHVQPADFGRAIFPTYASWVMKALAFLPAKWIPLWQRFLPATALVSLVPGSPQQLEIKGKIRVVDFWGLVGFHPCSFGCVVLSAPYAGKLKLGVFTGRKNLANGSASAERMVKTYMVQELDELQSNYHAIF